MLHIKSIHFKLTIILFISAFISSNIQAQQMGKEELKSMEKSNSAFKGGIGGLSKPGLNLPAKKMQWWRDAKFGMFIHWGLYAIPGTGEWTMFNKKMSPDEYAKLADQFKPRSFNADRWTAIAKAAGMKYMVMVARHHDGFAMWNSPSSYLHFNSMETASHTDFIAQYIAACRKAGLRVGIYYSPMDWRFPGYFDPKGLPENAAQMKQQAYGQINELMKNYGKIDILWYDGSWLAHKGSDVDAAWLWEPLKLNTMVRKYQSDIAINPRSGMYGDFQVNEGGAEVKGPILNFPWEKSLSLNGPSWGFTKAQNLMSLKDIVQMLVNVVDRGGNMLLNIGPDPDGIIPPAHVVLLTNVGSWLKKNGESIYGTRAGPFEPIDSLYGSTNKGNKVFIHLISSSRVTSELHLPKFDRNIWSCKLLNGQGLAFIQDNNGIKISISKNQLEPAVTTIVLTCAD